MMMVINNLYNLQLPYLQGPILLVYFFILATGCWLVLKFIVRKKISAHSVQFAKHNTTDNLYELAYLRGGTTEFMKMSCYQFLQRKWFATMVSNDHRLLKMIRKPGSFHSARISAEEEMILRRCTGKKIIYLDDILQDKKLKQEFQIYCESVKNKLAAKNLAWNSISEEKLQRIKFAFNFLLIAFSLVTLFLDFDVGHLIFLVWMNIVAAVRIEKDIQPPFASPEGEGLLNNLKEKYAYESYNITSLSPERRAIVISVFGMSVLQETELEWLDNFLTHNLNDKWYYFEADNWTFDTSDLAMD